MRRLVHLLFKGWFHEYLFDADEIRDPIIVMVEGNGWEWVPVAAMRNATFRH
jgi:hypothetical protein